MKLEFHTYFRLYYSRFNDSTKLRDTYVIIRLYPVCTGIYEALELITIHHIDTRLHYIRNSVLTK